MAIYKNKDIETNINERGAELGNINVNFYTEDKSTSSIRIIIKNNKRAVDLSKTNLTPKLDLFHSDGSIFMDENINNVLPEQGIIQYKISDRVIKHPGKVNAKLFLKNETQSVHIVNFNFTIKDSGITEAVNKEITVNIVDDSVRRIIQENAIELLGEGFKDDVSIELQNYVTTNTELFKGPKGDMGQQGLIGPKGPAGPKGDKGDKGDKGNDGQDLTSKLYSLKLSASKPFAGAELDVFYNQSNVTVRLQAVSDGSANNITSADTQIAQLPANVPRPLVTTRAVITSVSGGQAVQFTGNIIVTASGSINIKFDKNGDKISQYFGGSISYPVGEVVPVNFNKGFSRKYTFPEPNVLVTQGCDYKDGYIFGAVIKNNDNDIAKSIQVIDTNNLSNSFVAQGDLGVSMGHANGMSVVGKFGNEYLLYVAHLYEPTIVPIYINIVTKTARVGTGIITLKNESNSTIKTSSIDYFRKTNVGYEFGAFCVGHYYNFEIPNIYLDIPREIIGTKLFTIISNPQIVNDRKELFNDLYNQVSTHQSNRFVNGKYLIIQQNSNFSSVIEYEVQIESKSLKRTGRYWSAYKANKKRFEVESIFEIDGVLHGNVSEENFDGTGYDNYIISFDLHENT